MTAQQAFFRSAQVTLLAVLVGVVSAGAGLLVSLVGLLFAAGHGRRTLAARRYRREALERKAHQQARWDAQWASWGGRLNERTHRP